MVETVTVDGRMHLAALLLIGANLVLWMGLLDRLRGDARNLGWRAVDKAAYGLTAALLLTTGDFDPYAVLAITAGMYAGMSIGWGGAIGPALEHRRPHHYELEWWQRGPLARNAWAALAARGALWGLCVLPAAWLEPRAALALPAYIVAMPAAVWLTNRLRAPAPGDWTAQELYRGWIAGSLMLIGGLIVEATWIL